MPRIRLTWSLVAVAVSVACLSACRRSATAQPLTSSASSSLGGNDPAHPSIDCPLHKAGIDPRGLKPFEDVEKYVAFLERPDRAAWQKPDALVASLELVGNETVVDVGAGSGYFSFRIAKALPQGRVVATDVEPEMVRHIHHKAMAEGITNVEVVLGEPEDPKVPAGATLVFVCDVLHHVKTPSVWLSKMYAEAAAGTRLVVVEFKEGDLPEGPPKTLKMPRQQVVGLVTQAGFTSVGVDTTLLPYQYVLTFKKP